jgi:hypothetical protein
LIAAEELYGETVKENLETSKKVAKGFEKAAQGVTLAGVAISAVGGFL